MEVTQVLWRALEQPGLEHLALSENALSENTAGFAAESTVIGGGAQPFTLRYEVGGNADWHVLSVKLSVRDRSLHLTSDGEGHWRNADDRPAPHLDGCLDVDISATPFTNTLPIRRLKLEVGQAAEIRAVYISAPDLSVQNLQVRAARQRYTRLSTLTYRYESLESDFAAVIEVGERGLVTAYPNLFERLS